MRGFSDLSGCRSKMLTVNMTGVFLGTRIVIADLACSRVR
jgi:hypothetical protein